MKKIVSEPRLIGMVIVAIGVVLLVLGIAAEMSGGGEQQIDGPQPDLPEARNYYILIGVPTIIVGGIIAFIAARRAKKQRQEQ